MSRIVTAFSALINRIAGSLAGLPKRALPSLEAAYREADGAARLLYFDRQYKDMFGLLHKDAHEDSVPLNIEGIDAGILDVRLLCAPDLAVSKLGRFSSQDREDIAALRGISSSAPSGYDDAQKMRWWVMWATRAAVRIVADIEARGVTLSRR